MSLLSQDPSNYPYVVARVRHRRASLFGEEEYRKLLRMGPSEIARFMEETAYEEEINALGAKYDGVDLIEYALHANVAKHFDDLLHWSAGLLYDLVARYLRKFDAWNAKTILRGKYSDVDEETIRADLIDAGEFDERFIDSLFAADSIEAAVELLAETRIGEGLDDALDDYEATGLLIPIENAIDRAYFSALVTNNPQGGQAAQLYKTFLQAEIDFRNVRNVLRVQRSGADIDPAEYFIAGGTLFEASTIRSMAASRDELVARIRSSKYGDELTESLDGLESADSLVGFERALDAALVAYSDYLSHVYPLSVCPVLAFVLAKEREVDNIRAIARGLEAGIPREQIEAELVTL